MKRCWFGLALLILLLATGFLSTWYMDACHSRTAETLTEAEHQATLGNFEQAVLLSRHAHQQWQNSRRVSAALSDHEPMEQIDSLFDQLKLYAGEKDALGFSALCSQITSGLHAMADAQALNWWNLL